MLNEREQIWVETALAAVKGCAIQSSDPYLVKTNAIEIADHVLWEFDQKFRKNKNG